MEKLEADYNMFDWWKKVVFDNYANFEGRARRAEYWYFRLVNVIMAVIGTLIIVAFFAAFGEDSFVPFIPLIIALLVVMALIIPGLAVSARRLHDTGKSGWLLLIGVINVGAIILIVFYCIEGDKRPNKYGPDPKGGNDVEIDQIGTE